MSIERTQNEGPEISLDEDLPCGGGGRDEEEREDSFAVEDMQDWEVALECKGRSPRCLPGSGLAIVWVLDCNFGSNHEGSKSRRQREMNSSVSDLNVKPQKKQLVAVGTRNENQIDMSLAKRAHLCG